MCEYEKPEFSQLGTSERGSFLDVENIEENRTKGLEKVRKVGGKVLGGGLGKGCSIIEGRATHLEGLATRIGGGCSKERGRGKGKEN